MATLSEQPISTTCILPPPTLPKPRLVSNESNVSIRTTSATTTSFFCHPAALRDSPTTVPMTAASSGVDDDDRPRSDSSPAPMKEDPTALTQTFLQEWNTFYGEFVDSDNYQCYVKPHKETAAIDAAAADKIAPLQSNHQLPPTAAPQTTPPQPCLSLKQLIPSIQTTLPALPISSPHASPSDSPTTVNMPAAPPATANEPVWSNPTRKHSSNVAPPTIYTHEQHGVYTEISQSNRKHQNATPAAVLSGIDTAEADRSTSSNGTPPSTDVLIELDQSDTRGLETTTPVTITCPEHSDPLHEVFQRMTDKLDRLIEQSQRHYATMAKTNQQMQAHMQELVQLTPLFLAIVPTYHYDLEPPQQHDNLTRPATAPTLANSQIQPWTTVASFLPRSIVATVSIHAINHVKKVSMAFSPLHQQPLHHTDRSRRLSTSPYPTQQKTPDMFFKPMKHVRFKTTALSSPGPWMFWPKEDMRPP